MNPREVPTVRVVFPNGLIVHVQDKLPYLKLRAQVERIELEFDGLKNASDHRKAEFTQARLLATKLLLGACAALDGTYPRVKNGAPDWPDAFAGSISHSDQCIAVAIKLKDAGLVGIGVDIETSHTSEQQNAALVDCFTSAELALLDIHPFGRIAGFSAKEALIKALLPSPDFRANFHADHQAIELNEFESLGGTLSSFAFRVLCCPHLAFAPAKIYVKALDKLSTQIVSATVIHVAN